MDSRDDAAIAELEERSRALEREWNRLSAISIEHPFRRGARMGLRAALAVLILFGLLTVVAMFGFPIPGG